MSYSGHHFIKALEESNLKKYFLGAIVCSSDTLYRKPDPKIFELALDKDSVNQMMSDSNYKKVLDDEFELMMNNRDILRNKYFINTEVIGDINTFIPFNLYRIIPSIRTKFNIEDPFIKNLPEIVNLIKIGTCFIQPF